MFYRLYRHLFIPSKHDFLCVARMLGQLIVIFQDHNEWIAFKPLKLHRGEWNKFFLSKKHVDGEGSVVDWRLLSSIISICVFYGLISLCNGCKSIVTYNVLNIYEKIQCK